MATDSCFLSGDSGRLWNLRRQLCVPGNRLDASRANPFANSLQVNNSDCPQTLRAGPTSCGISTRNTFAVDPNFRIGYAQAWNLSAQRNIPGALVATISYFGVKGTRGLQDLLPNTYPLGATASNPTAPVGFLYRSSNGDSIRHAGTLQIRRRLQSGLTVTGEYTYSRPVDNDSILGGEGPVAKSLLGNTGSTGSNNSSRTATIAQNWLNLRAERSLSTFDQRNLLTAIMQYTTGVGVHGGTLLSDWRSRFYKDWTVAMQASVGSGLPETPIYLAAVPGTGYTGSTRPDRTATDPYAATAGAFFNAAAFTAPASGAWGDAGRNSLRGPGTYTFNSSLGRTFRIEKALNLDIRADATNLLNLSFTLPTTTSSTPTSSIRSSVFQPQPAPCALSSSQRGSGSDDSFNPRLRTPVPCRFCMLGSGRRQQQKRGTG